VTIFGFNYALGGGFYLASGLPISSPLHPPSCMPEVEKGKKKKSRVGEYKTAESLGFAGVLNPGKESDKVYAIVGVKGVGSVAIRAGEKES
jgi:hypothetical protein